MSSKEQLKTTLREIMEKENSIELLESIFEKIEEGVIYSELTNEEILEVLKETRPGDEVTLQEDFQYNGKNFKRMTPRYLTMKERQEFMRRVSESGEFSAIARLNTEKSISEIRVIGEDENGNLCIGSIPRLKPLFTINLQRTMQTNEDTSLSEAVTFIDNCGLLKTTSAEEYNKEMHKHKFSSQIKDVKKKNKNTKEYKLEEGGNDE